MAEFTPAGLAGTIRDSVRPDADPLDRDTIKGLLDYHHEYLNVTAHCDGSRPSPMKDGTVVYWSWQASREALFFSQTYGMAVGCYDKDEKEQARKEWRQMDWDAEYERLGRQQRQAASL